MSPPPIAATAAFNLAPVLELLLLALTLAGFILLWWRLRTQHAPLPMRAYSLALLTLFLCFDLVVFGAFTRLSDSGLGCPDWPGCYGQMSPFSAHSAISQAEQAMPFGPVSHSKAWIEMLHRYLAMTVGALILLTASWLLLARERFAAFGIRPWRSIACLCMVCLQGAFGAWTVSLKLQPAIVTLHLLGGLLLLLLLHLQLHHFGHAKHHSSVSLHFHARPHRRWVLLGLLLLLMQIVLGAWVSSNYAVLVCSEYPLCQGRLWPEMDFAQGFSIWRPLGKTANGELLSMQALTAIHWAHRWFSVLVFVFLAALAWRYRRLVPVYSRLLAGLLLLQFASGLSNVVLGWPLLAALLHTAGAAALLLTMSELLLRLNDKVH